MALLHGPSWATAAVVTAACVLAACGSSDDSASSDPMSYKEIAACFDVVGIPVSGSPALGIDVPAGGGRTATIVIEDSEADAQQAADSWKTFGEDSGEAATVLVEGPVWVGYQEPVKDELKSTVEHCAFGT